MYRGVTLAKWRKEIRDQLAHIDDSEIHNMSIVAV